MEKGHCRSDTQGHHGIDTLRNQNTLRHFRSKDKKGYEAQKRDHGKNGVDDKKGVEKVTHRLVGNLLRPVRFHFYKEPTFFHAVE